MFFKHLCHKNQKNCKFHKSINQEVHVHGRSWRQLFALRSLWTDVVLPDTSAHGICSIYVS